MRKPKYKMGQKLYCLNSFPTEEQRLKDIMFCVLNMENIPIAYVDDIDVDDELEEVSFVYGLHSLDNMSFYSYHECNLMSERELINFLKEELRKPFYSKKVGCPENSIRVFLHATINETHIL